MEGQNIPAHYLTDLLILKETAEQIKKDFSIFSLDVSFSGNRDNAYQELFDQVHPHIKKLAEANYEKLLTLLYRVDLNEARLKKELLARKEEEPAKIIADMILKRCLQKVILRKLYSK